MDHAIITEELPALPPTQQKIMRLRLEGLTQSIEFIERLSS